jgi:cob(I)alamin adenosyltransferase
MAQDNPPISTARGDDGTTTLLGAGRLPKDDARIALLGDIDEASACLGLARAEAADEQLRELMLEIQRLLYRIMGDVAMPGEANVVGEDDIGRVDEALETWKTRVKLPNEFVVPGETRLGALMDFARATVRRAERSMISAELTRSHPQALAVVNRVSDVLFVVARYADGKVARSKG